ncbi:hypothetical protein GQ55_8G215900 [Panicum hallii var. hallii]|uniref:TNFR-Cys domain-containing protein n=1 Tax=Panicum hallii var. hallii TaxID=1504633 RepID=A0A2T7CPV3_9POAL|nr:hypothetical protein GQ55_8G215900 [Panicum hallii var. hallii]
MVSSAAGLKAATAVAIFAVLVMSSQGHPRTKPLCSDCPSLCNTNCSAVIAATCNSTCSPPVAECDRCKSQVLQGCCQDFCSSSHGTSSYSCCPSDCIGGNCTTCSCDSCNAALQDRCTFACSMHASDLARCEGCKNGVGQQCYSPCISACNDHCVKKDC